MRDWYSVMLTAEQKGLEKGLEKGLKKGLEQGLKKGLEQGLEQGRAEGQEESARHIALKLKQMGMPMADIVKATGLSESQIEDLS